MRVAFAHFKEIIFAAGLVFLTTNILAAVTVPSNTGSGGDFGLRRSG